MVRAQIREFWMVVMRGQSLPESPKNLDGPATPGVFDKKPFDEKLGVYPRVS